MNSTANGQVPGVSAPPADEKTTTPLGDKRVANIKAELALRGFSTHDTVPGGWLVARWNMSLYCPRVEDLAAFLRRVGGSA